MMTILPAAMSAMISSISLNAASMALGCAVVLSAITVFLQKIHRHAAFVLRQQPLEIATAAVRHARNHHIDVVIIDTAGRLHIDQDMMSEIRDLHTALDPVETLFVVDSMTGQDAANTARAFNDALPLSGIVLTKTDGDARGGAALSMITGAILTETNGATMLLLMMFLSSFCGVAASIYVMRRSAQVGTDA